MLAGQLVACVTIPAAPRAGQPPPARCYVEGRDVAEAMVAAGWAVTTERASNRYVSAQETARLARRGMWAGPFEMPGATPGAARRTP
jgi:endonuclease YncB( thermonuclease family)